MVKIETPRPERMFTPDHCPELDPDEGAQSLSRRHMSNFTAHDSHELTRKVKNELLRLQKSQKLLEG